MTPVIFSFPEDFHAAAVAWGLRKLGRDPVFVPVNWCLDTVPITFGVDAEGASSLTLGGRAVPPGSACWLRRPYPANLSAFDSIHALDRAFAGRNARQFYDELLHLLDVHCFCVNTHAATRRAGYKAAQLVLARQAGFRIAPTILTNDPDTAVACAANRETVSKALVQDSWVREGELVAAFTSRVVPEQIIASASTLAACPVYLQDLLTSDTELRVLVLGHTVVAVDLGWSNGEGERVDWRRDPAGLAPRRVELPTDVHDAVLAFARLMDLRFGAIDLIRRGDDFYFLEVNPAGQWIWLTQDTEDLNVFDMFVQFLASGRPDFRYETPSGLTIAEYRASEGGALDAANAVQDEQGRPAGGRAFETYYHPLSNAR